MMEEKQLQNLPLFRKLGAFSIVREKPREALKSVNYSVKLLKAKPQQTVWIFPQGEILPNNARPLKFFNGISHIVNKVENCAVISLAMSFEFLGNFKPEILVKISEANIYSSENSFAAKHLTDIFAEQLTETLDKLKKDVVGENLADYRNIL